MRLRPVYNGDVLITGLIDRCTNNRVSVSIPMGPSVAEGNTWRRTKEGFRVSACGSEKVRAKGLTFSLPQALTLNPSTPTNRKATTKQMQNILTFPPVRVRVNNPHSCDMGARVSEPPKTLLALNPAFF